MSQTNAGTMEMLDATDKNKREEALRLVDEWFAEPDGRGDAYWDELRDEIARNRFSLRLHETQP